MDAPRDDIKIYFFGFRRRRDPGTPVPCSFFHAWQAEAAAPRGMADPSAAAAGSVGFDFVFPVEVADGRRLELRWNRSDDPLPGTRPLDWV